MQNLTCLCTPIGRQFTQLADSLGMVVTPSMIGDTFVSRILTSQSAFTRILTHPPAPQMTFNVFARQ